MKKLSEKAREISKLYDTETGDIKDGSNIKKLHNTEKNFNDNDGLAHLQTAYKKQLIKAGEKHAY